MKVAVLGHRRFPIAEPFAGGLERFTHQLVTGLKQRDCEVSLFAQDNSDRSLDVALEPIIDTSFCTDWSEESHEAYLNIMDYLSTQDFDLVHDNSLNYFPMVLADSLNAPLVTTLHTPPFPRLLSAVRYRERRQQGNYIAVSNANADLWGISSHRLQTIYNGVDTKAFCDTVYEHRTHAVWIGRIVPEKGTHLAIAAAQKANIPLVIAGKIGDEKYFETAVQPYLGKGVKYVGHLKQPELVELLQSATVTLCTPVWSEPFGLVVIESLACGTPVVAFNRGAMSEILTRYTGIIVPPNDTDAMAEGIFKAKKLSRFACRKDAVERFSISKTIDNYLQAYERIIKQHKQQRICSLVTTYTSTVADTLIEPERSRHASLSPLPSSALTSVNISGTE